ncbi:ABC transporter ATP-binding protein [Oceanobacillus alkalisoli]|uniref:ABC transporter ATP-binding protein n=1 Tax=Oceanobacillus alkalisoli TaxID=2925113 RepID=UPI001EEF9961|nr:ABC transporter ATP-binding protein [Oceanobacillus alkalisoli]MCF3941984.1 ABC transporter ATP-binding protein [Oceanobacillus alkalisoli]MCG5102063.1 ABC transporter ATP-binding protein [Oceanobacillus alkalisoli]
MLELIDITKKYKQTKAVKNMNMYIEKGEIVGLLGPNGAGKSTAISILSSLLEPTSGDVKFRNKSMIKNPKSLRQIIGIVPQEIALYEDLSAEENMKFFGRIYRLKGEKLKNKISEVLEQIGLADRRKDVVKTFSGGMKRRLNIGVAMLHDPEILIMDEPTVGIDPQSRNYILQTVKRLNKERQMTVLYTSHYMEEVEYLCDRIYIMDKGNLIASGTKDEIKQILASENTIYLKADYWNESFITKLQEKPQIHQMKVEGNEIVLVVSKDVAIFSKLAHLAEETSVQLRAVDVKQVTLEDVFLHLTGRALRD